MFFRFCSVAVLLLASKAYCQQVSVNPLTGAVNYQLQLVSLTTGNISYLVSISYYGNGIKVDDVTGIAGLGWQLNNTGAVYRELRGLPDDYKGISSDVRRGWLRGTAAADLKTASFSSDGSCSTCSDEYIDWTKLNGYGFTQDTEPDKFVVSLPNFSFSFYFDNDGNIRLENFDDFKVTYALHETSGITSFTITDPAGNVYNFNNRSQVSRSIDETLTTSPYFKYSRKLYATSVTYTGAWYLANITDTFGNTMSFSYEAINNITHRHKNYEEESTLEYKIGVSNGTTLATKNTYSFATSLNTHFLTSITTSNNDKVTFVKSPFVSNANLLLDSVSLFSNLTSLVKSYKFVYAGRAEDPTTLENYFLTDVKERSAGKTNLAYSFDYYYSSRIETVPVTYGSSQQDYWGYYNGNAVSHSFPEIHVYPDLPAAERYRIYPIDSAVYSGAHYTLKGHRRDVNPHVMMVNALKKVKHPHGGYTSIVYEPNAYYDSIAGQDFFGGGIRVKKLITHDGVTADNQVENYDYTTDGHSSGVIVYRPSFAFPISYHSDLNKTFEEVSSTYTGQQTWELMTARSNRDLAAQGDQVLYSQVIIKPATGGSVQYSYAISAVHGDSSAESNEWQATRMRVSRKNNGTSQPCDATGQLTSLSGQGFVFPYLMNANYNVGRGRLQEVVIRDDVDSLVSRTTNVYGKKYKGGSVNRIKALGLEIHSTYKIGSSPRADSTLFLFGTYDILTGITPVLLEQHVYTPHPTDGSRVAETVTYNTHGASAHARLTEQQSTASDGTEYFTVYKYPDDFTITQTTKDTQSTLIHKKVQQNAVGMPVELVMLRKPAGSSTREVTGAQVSQYGSFNTTGVLPGSQSVLELSAPITESSFVYATVTNTGAQSLFVSDSRYVQTRQNLNFDKKGNLLAATNRSQVVSAALLDTVARLAVFSVQGANTSEIVFSDFDKKHTRTFQWDGTGSTGFIYHTSGHDSKSLKLQRGLEYGAESSFTRQQDTYILSYWTNTCSVEVSDGSAAGTGNLKAYFYAGITLVKTVTLQYAAPSAWKYFENTIDLSGLSTELTVVLKSEYNNTCLDDIALYPANSVTSSFAYDDKNRLILSTDNKGRGRRIDYDAFGRVLTVRDHTGAIVETNTYNYGN